VSYLARQELGRRAIAALAGQVGRGAALAILQVRIGSMVQEELDQLGMVSQNGLDERGRAVLIL
jgi:hypothetical protein